MHHSLSPYHTVRYTTRFELESRMTGYGNTYDEITKIVNGYLWVNEANMCSHTSDFTRSNWRKIGKLDEISGLSVTPGFPVELDIHLDELKQLVETARTSGITKESVHRAVELLILTRPLKGNSKCMTIRGDAINTFSQSKDILGV